VKKIPEQEMKSFYDGHIASKRLYRVFSSEYLDDVMQNGLDPRRNPYKHMYNEIKKLFKVLLWLERHDFGHKQDWGKEIGAEKIVRVSLEDMERQFIDFAPQRMVENYIRLLTNTGGALVSTVRKITDDILIRQPRLPLTYNISRVKRLNEWCKEKGKHKPVVIYIQGSSSCLEDALFQLHGSYYKSPFGSFEHFCQVVNDGNFDFYRAQLEKEEYHLRKITPVPKGEINLM
jgi:hypothetical protein